MVPCNDIPRGLNVPSKTQRGNTMPLNDELEGRMSYSLARSPLRLPGSADIIYLQLYIYYTYIYTYILHTYLYIYIYIYIIHIYILYIYIYIYYK